MGHDISPADQLLIGQAQGILMGQLDTDSEGALRFLTHLALENNRTPADVAADVVRAHGPHDAG